MPVSRPCIDSWPRIDSSRVRGHDCDVVDESQVPQIRRKATDSGQKKRLKTTASGAMARCTLTSSKLPLPCTNNQKPSPPQQDQDNKTTKWEERWRGVPGQSWVSHVGLPFFFLFFCGGREIQGQCDQSITMLIDIQGPPVVGLPRWQSWQCGLLAESEFVALLLVVYAGQILKSVQ